jgi:hypothetical protein
VTFLLAVVVFPLLMAVLALGAGLLVERAGGFAMPALLLVPTGFAALVAVTQLTTWSGAIAPATPAMVVLVALAGGALSWRGVVARWRARRSGWWWGWSAGVAAYVTVAAPVLLSGRVTFPGYLLDTTGAVQLIGAERLVTEGQSFSAPGSGYGLVLDGFFGTGYPTGAHGVLGGAGRLVGVDMIWLYAPFLAVLLGFAALVLAFLARSAGLARPAAALTGLVAAVPALVYSYALQGSIKEIALLPIVLLLGALTLLARPMAAAGPRAMVPLGVVGAAGWSTIGFAFTPWLALTALAVLALGWTALAGSARVRVRAVVLRGGVLAGALVLLALPTVAKLQTSLDQATNVTDANAAAVADPGNLLRPLLKVQALGVWLGSSHRGDPEHVTQSYALIGVVAVGVLLGVTWLVRRRRWDLLAVIAVSLAVWLLLTPRATTWTAAKLIVLVSPIVILVALIGAFGRLGARRLEGLLLGAAIAFGVLASDAYLYHYTTMAPAQRFEELRQIGERFAGTRPTLTPDFDEYALYLLRDMDPDGPGNSRKVQPWTTADGQFTGYGHSYDLDALAAPLIDGFAAIVVRRSPFRSRPPATFSLAWRGRDYDVWRRTEAPAARERLSLGEAGQPVDTPSCPDVGAFATRAREDGATELRFLARPPNVAVALARTRRTTLAALQEDGSIAFGGPGTVIARLTVPRAGSYRLWVEGNSGRELIATVDGRPYGVVDSVSGGSGNVLRFGVATLAAGTHVLRLERPGGGLAPGDAAFTNIRAIALEPSAAVAAPVRTAPIGSWRSLCGRSLDWVEAV